MSYVEKINVICIDECTTHEIILKVKNKDNIDFSQYEAVFTSICDGSHIEKTCGVEGNVFSVVLDPTETVIYCDESELEDGAFTRPFQIRVFKDGKVYQVAKGRLKIYKVHKNYTENPLKAGE